MGKVVLRFGRYEEFWEFCFGHCRSFRVGCACSCVLRRELGIPPFGESYLGKMKGEIKSDAK